MLRRFRLPPWPGHDAPLGRFVMAWAGLTLLLMVYFAAVLGAFVLLIEAFQ
jgi:hypothetical protein